jgi:hypothetical protein
MLGFRQNVTSAHWLHRRETWLVPGTALSVWCHAIILPGGSNEPRARIEDKSLKTSRAPAIAGILFSLLFITSHLLIRNSSPADPLGSATQVVNHSQTLFCALNLMPIYRHRLLMVHRRGPRPLGEAGRRFFLPPSPPGAGCNILRCSMPQEHLEEGSCWS